MERFDGVEGTGLSDRYNESRNLTTNEMGSGNTLRARVRHCNRVFDR